MLLSHGEIATDHEQSSWISVVPARTPTASELGEGQAKALAEARHAVEVHLQIIFAVEVLDIVGRNLPVVGSIAIDVRA
jgi:hypothetical protein